MIPEFIIILAVQYIVLHNSYDEHSRAVVEQIPWNSSDRFCVIDWYRNPKERWHRSCTCHYGQPYMGPPPSAFPEIVKQRSDGTWARIRAANSIDDRLDESKYENVNADGECLGGQWLSDIPNTIRAEKTLGQVGLAKFIEDTLRSQLKKSRQLEVHGRVLLPSATTPRHYVRNSEENTN
jgi:hypothetical protein